MASSTVLIIIFLYFGLLLSISFITSRSADNSSFFLGNRKSPWYIVAFGMIGASLSGVTFISVPGWVGTSQFTYMQMVFGYLLGYIVIANVLMPIYYRMNLTSIYTYLESRFGFWSYKTGAAFFLLSRTFGAAARLYLVAIVLQLIIFDNMGIPFWLTVVFTIILIWLYTFRGGIKTIIWTDTLQTLFMLLAVIFSVYFLTKELGLNISNLFDTIENDENSKIWIFDNWQASNYFLKHFLGGAFIAITMTGMDQDMMQKNLSCRNISEAKKNMYWFSFVLIFVNFLFLSLGLLLYKFADIQQIALPERSDELFPLIAADGHLGLTVSVLFTIGLIAAAYSSADSALTSLTTSFTMDFLNKRNTNEKTLKKNRFKSHIAFSVILAIVILILKAINDRSVIDVIFKVAGYTYGPILGIFAFGIISKRKVRDKFVPVIAIAAPIVSYLIQSNSESWFNGYKFGYELLILNGLLTFLGMYILQYSNKG